MEHSISKNPWQSRNISINRNSLAMSSLPTNADLYSNEPFHWSDISQPTYDQMIYHQYIRWNQARNGKVQYRGQSPQLLQRAVYRRQLEDDVALGRYGFYHGEEISGPYHDSYSSQVLKESSPQTTEKLATVKDQNYYSTKFAPQYSNWSPLDDGIEINPTFTSSREDFNECIDFTLYGPTRRKRLPVFTNICPV